MAEQTTHRVDIRIEVDETRPQVWRRVIVRPDLTLAALHLIVQRCLGWPNDTQYAFLAAQIRYSLHDHDMMWRPHPRDYDVCVVTLADILASTPVVTYLFGAPERAISHTLRCRVLTAQDGVSQDDAPRCVDGEHGVSRSALGARAHEGFFDRDEITLPPHQELLRQANASAGLDVMELWALAQGEQETSAQQVVFEQEVRRWQAPVARAMPPEFISVQALAALVRQAPGAMEGGDLLDSVQQVASLHGVLTNLHTRQLVVDLLRRDPQPVSPQASAPPPALSAAQHGLKPQVTSEDLATHPEPPGDAFEGLRAQALKPLPRQRTLKRALSALSAAQLDRVVEALHMQEVPAERAERAASAQALLSRLEVIEELVEGCDAAQAGLLEALVQRAQPMALEDVGLCGVSAQDVEALRSRGLLYISTQADAPVCWLPLELEQLLGIALQ